MEEFELEEKKESSIFRKIFFLILLTLILLFVYATYIGPTGLRLKEYSIYNEKIDISYDGLKIAHFSDIHYGRIIKEEELKMLVKKINLSKPDIVFFTGDLFDKVHKISNNDIINVTNELSKIQSKYGKFFISGDHDIENKNYQRIMESAKFINLNDNYNIVTNNYNQSIIIAGINYNSNGEYLNELLKNSLPDYKILVMHTPDTIDNVKKYNFDLVLAGHSHLGQIKLPFIGSIYTPEGAKKYYKDYYHINSADFYISSGIGTTNFDYRLFNRPSFNLYRLKSKIQDNTWIFLMP